ncbi:DinB family protein [Actinospica sp. MGRD01-02]|uniref:DinB family protein n=1 Tax=Actinospica acidithermotolerans TaxID=2828514 RepID=A0A941EF40_9ACTN|nr:DinB family protein [Actinospica acidithermotolerans]MBR7827904.1 DinB family protein [Actinospica acidithermotolerans]
MDTFKSPLEYVDAPSVAPEREALAGWLDAQRAELLAKLDGLTDEQADRRVVPSLNTLHGLVRHLTKVEFVWFETVIAGSDAPAPFGFPDRKDGDFLLDDGESVEADAARFIAACERSREIFSSVGLDEVRTHRRIGEVDVRWIMVHLIREYAQHNGHADILRELVDGTTQS